MPLLLEPLLSLQCSTTYRAKRSLKRRPVTLKTLKDVAETAQIPGLVAIPSLALEILAVAQDIKQNKDAFQRLAKDAFGVATVISELWALQSTIEDILECAKNQTSENRVETRMKSTSEAMIFKLSEYHLSQQLQHPFCRDFGQAIFLLMMQHT
ncbi:hypothetical protein Moror_5480 [Moniliophthora roreri MCA 2997]|uniref:Uncharacterized protein n=1 Tax=Moniliophthora roreri (strain MCA 2997) TaxID=1381753 RepID=V2X716_MONRO|nr:hypothetical protein Moror_5480 [Moniliophthora roreri MCA 2997]